MAVLLGCAILTASAHAVGGATRTWVSGVGDDINTCSRTAPCRTFAGAISKTGENGEIDVLDSGGFGAVTITKGITIDGTGVIGGVLNGGTTGITVNAGPDDAVVLRGLSIDGAGPITGPPASGCVFSGLTGVSVRSAGSVRIESTLIADQQQAGIAVIPSAAGPNVVLDGVTVTNGCGTGVDVAPTATGTAHVLVRNTSISNTATGLHVGAGGHAWLTGSSVFGNDTGLLVDGGGIIDAIDQNQIAGNGTNGSPTTTSSSAPPVTVPGPTQVVTVLGPTVTGPTQTITVTKDVPVPAPTRCIVPTLTGLTVSAATAKLKKASCAIGTTTAKTTTSKKLVGKVTVQRTEAGLTATAGTRVNVTVGKKAAKKKAKKAARRR